MGRPAEPLADRFWKYVNRTNTCWLWTGAGAPGYGRIGESRTRRLLLAHRVSYEMAYGPIPPACDIDHLCFVRACVRPDHLEAVSHRTNLRRADRRYLIRTAKTHCPAGHPYDEANTARAGGRRSCKECGRTRAAAAYKHKGPVWTDAATKHAYFVKLGKTSVTARRAKYAAMKRPPCADSECERLAEAFKGGLCNMHKLRARRAAFGR